MRDPHQADRYAIGIECDGRAYHSTRVARDRDRLRADVLRGLGWNLHRVWGPAWYRTREREAQRLREAIEQAVEAGAPVRHRAAPEPVKREVVEVAPADPTDDPDWAAPYILAAPPLPHHDHPGEPGAFTETVQTVRDILVTEAPIHVEVLSRRVANVFERSLTDRVRRAVDNAVLTLRRRGDCQQERAWVRPVNWDPTTAMVRVPTDEPENFRDVEHIPPEEIDAAITNLVEDAHLIAERDLLVAVSRLFGVARTTQRINATLEDALARLVDTGRLERTGAGMVRTARRSR